ncbi:MAG: acyl-CoA dehydrogenase [Desulfobacteraceae bacterium]|nr:acyl-CoA dehydrogenase family protein [Desulfobacteraceae bacterium]MBC2754808.1 acyl-CoA dehydrogenase [Desulfobacteraceae bacterium]
MGKNKLQKRVLDSAKEFIAKEIAPVAAMTDEKEKFPLKNFKEMGRLGFLGIPYPEKFGGAELDYLTYATIVREIAKVCASTAMSVVAHTGLAGNPIFSFGSEKQKIKFLKPLALGEKIGAFGLTEPNAGSDIAAMETTAEKKENHYILNGTKIFITNANVADIYVVAAKTSPEKGMMGISMFVLEKGTEGFKASGKKEKKLGMKGADTGELIFDNAIVPEKNLIGRKNWGLKILHQTLVGARIGMAAIALGISEGAQKYCLEYVKQRKQFGEYLYHFQSIKNMLADMEMNTSAADLLLQKAAVMKDEGRNVTKEASEAKLFASEMAMKITKDAIQIFGGYGYSQDLPLERFFRDAKITEIGDGTSEIQRLIIADEIIKRPT